MAKTADYGFGDFAFPRGWFMVAGADEVADRPVPVRYFGEDMVLYRGESGTAHLVSAYCPHMGAHLARNATSYIIRDGQQIEGESIRCPFHGWQFGPDGRCTAIPYSDFVPGAARLKTWPVVERAGIIWMWHVRIPRSSRAAFRFDRARHSEMMARSVPRIVRAAFRNDRAQFEVRGT